jgi:spore coat protein U-like protein
MKFYSRSVIATIAVFFLCACGFFSAAHSQSCNFSITGVAFGTVDVTANAAVDTTATLSVTCTASVALRVCVNLGPGTGGGANAANRLMKSGSSTLTYGLFSDAARSTPWGSNFWAGGGAGPVLVDFPLFIGTSNKTRTVYGRAYSGQQTVPAGSYLSTFSSTDAEIQYGLLSLGSCNLLTNTNTTTFNVRATVPTTCSIATNDLNFGTAGTLATNSDASTTVSPTCTSGTAYNIGLNGGLSGATDPTQRKMTKAAEFVLYGLYRDSARSLPWQYHWDQYSPRHRLGPRPIGFRFWPNSTAPHVSRHPTNLSPRQPLL